MKKLKVGDFIETCRYHPVLVTEVDGDDILGISLIDGSYPNCCSIDHCGLLKLSLKDAINIKINWNKHPFRDWDMENWLDKDTGKKMTKEIFSKRVDEFFKLMGWKNHRNWKD